MKHTMLAILLLSLSTLMGTILTVDNRVPSGGLFPTFDAAYTAAADGDSIHLYPSATEYNLTGPISKCLHIFGGGFEYSGNFNLPNRTEISSSITYSLGSASGSITGILIDGSMTLNDDGIKISNCQVTSDLTINGNNSTIKESKLHGVRIMQGYVNTSINNCYVYTAGIYTGSYIYGIKFDGSNTAVINNSIIDFSLSSVYHTYGIHISNACEILISNNYIGVTNNNVGETSLYSSSEITVINNIIYEDVTASLTYFTYNILSDNLSDLPPTNIGSYNVADLFVDWSGNDFHLAPGSLAIGFGEGGVDCGPYGGTSPFNDNYGISPLPTIIELHSPSVAVPADGPLEVEIRASTIQD